MPNLLVATGSILQQIYDETWPIWSDGLSRPDYERHNRAQMSTPWGAGHLERVAWTDGDALLASAKRYRFTLRLGGSTSTCVGIGAVFTPPSQRKRGHAAALIEAMLAEAEREGIRHALLFSEIDPAYYARLGFEPFAVTEAVLGLRPQPRPGAPGVLVRAGDDRDIAAVSAMHEARAGRYALALDRDPEYVRHAITKRRLLAAFAPAGVRQLEFFVAEEGATAVAYIVVSRGPEGQVLEEWGDRDPSGARVGAMLQVLAARTPAEAVEPLRTWVPADFHPPQLERIREGQPRETGMIRGITGPAPPIGPDGAFYLKADVF